MTLVNSDFKKECFPPTVPPVSHSFARAPVPGQVSTRLQPRLCTGRAQLRQMGFADDMLEMLRADLAMADIELHTDVSTEAWLRRGVPQKLQAARDLGARLRFALAGALACGRRQVMVVGSDAPTLPASVAISCRQWRTSRSAQPAMADTTRSLAARCTRECLTASPGPGRKP